MERLKLLESQRAVKAGKDSRFSHSGAALLKGVSKDGESPLS